MGLRLNSGQMILNPECCAVLFVARACMTISLYHIYVQSNFLPLFLAA
jgi:hypothetical protein